MDHRISTSVPSSMTAETMATDVDLTPTEQLTPQSVVSATAAANAAATASSPSSSHAVKANKIGGSANGWGSSQGKPFFLLICLLQMILHGNQTSSRSLSGNCIKFIFTKNSGFFFYGF